MSAKDKVMIHPVNQSREQTWSGFSWPCLFFGCAWYMYKGMWSWAGISILVVLVTGGLAWLVFPFYANGQHKKQLIKDGYSSEAEVEGKIREQRMEKAIAAKVAYGRTSSPRHSGSVAEELSNSLLK